MKRYSSRSGQTMVEYIIIVVIVAVAAIAIFGVFGDTLRKKLSGAVSEMDSGDSAAAAHDAVSTSSKDWLKDMTESGSSGAGGGGGTVGR
jgi:Flp pilus assembly pilin Flp